jgi:hypothetical protein
MQYHNFYATPFSSKGLLHYHALTGLKEILIKNGTNGVRKRGGIGAIIKNGSNDAELKAEG